MEDERSKGLNSHKNVGPAFLLPFDPLRTSNTSLSLQGSNNKERKRKKKRET